MWASEHVLLMGNFRMNIQMEVSTLGIEINFHSPNRLLRKRYLAHSLNFLTSFFSIDEIFFITKRGKSNQSAKWYFSALSSEKFVHTYPWKMYFRPLRFWERQCRFSSLFWSVLKRAAGVDKRFHYCTSTEKKNHFCTVFEVFVWK